MAAYISDSKNILQKNMKKNFITKKYQGVKFSREAVRAQNSTASHPLLPKTGGSPRIVLSNQNYDYGITVYVSLVSICFLWSLFCILNLLLMEYVEDEFTDALIDAICGEDLSSPSI